jgi:outer membrane biosynthesis protein TonB
VPDNIPLPEVKPQAQPPKTADKTPDVKPDPKPEVKPETKPAPVKPETKPTDKTVTQSTNKSPDDGKKNDDKKRETAKGSTAQDSEFNADDISKLLNKNASAGGAARSKQEASAGANTQVASIGGKKSAGGGKLSQSEIDGLKSLIQSNWSVPNAGIDGASEVRVKVVMQLDRSGNIVGDPQVTATGGPEAIREVIASSAQRAVLRSAPFKPDLLPADKYEGDNGWNQLVLNFDASDLGL